MKLWNFLFGKDEFEESRINGILLGILSQLKSMNEQIIGILDVIDGLDKRISQLEERTNVWKRIK